MVKYSVEAFVISTKKKKTIKNSNLVPINGTFYFLLNKKKIIKYIK